MSENNTHGGARKGAGRPPGRAKDRRSVLLQVRLTKAERRDLDKAAGDQDTSTWLRELGLAAARKEGDR